MTLPPIVVTNEEPPTESRGQSGKRKGSGSAGGGGASPIKGVSVSMPEAVFGDSVKVNGIQVTLV